MWHHHPWALAPGPAGMKKMCEDHNPQTDADLLFTLTANQVHSTFMMDLCAAAGAVLAYIDLHDGRLVEICHMLACAGNIHQRQHSPAFGHFVGRQLY